MAVLHEHAAKVAELKCDFYFAAWMQAPDVLASFLPGGNFRRASIARKRLALLDVHTSRVPKRGAAEIRPKSAASVGPWLSVLMPHGPKNVVIGSLVV